MRNSILFYLICIFPSVFLWSCNKNKNDGGVNTTEFNKGVFVVDEGNYSDADGEVTFINFENGDVYHNVFQNANGRPFAGVIQSLAIYKNKGYLVDELGRLEVVDALTFTSAGEITSGFSNPRYFAGKDNKGYVTDWGPYDADYNNKQSKIIEINLDNLQITDSVTTLSRPEGIIVTGDYIFVANSATNKVSVYNARDLTDVGEIDVAYGPVRFVSDKSGDLWVACTGLDSTRSAIEKIDPVELKVISTFNLPESITLNGKIAINGTGDVIYLMSEQWSADYSSSKNIVFAQPVSQGSFSFTSVISRDNLYGLGVDPDNNNVYVADAKGFQSNGMIYAYNNNGLLLDSAQVDRGPSDFVFVNVQ